MRIYAHCPPYLWDEFYLTAAHLHSKTITHSLKDGITPWEKFYECKPDYSYMREIGCCVFVLIQNKHNPKVYECSLECVLIGYDPKAKTYRFYHPDSKKVISSYHVWFLKSHDGHLPSVPTEEEIIPMTLKDILTGGTPVPIHIDEDEETLPLNKHQLDIPEPIQTTILNDDIQPRRSSCIAEKPIESIPTRTERAIQDSIEAGIRVKEAHVE